MGSRMLKRWLHSADPRYQGSHTRQHGDRRIAELFTRSAAFAASGGRSERILRASGAAHRRPRDLARMRHAFQQLSDIPRCCKMLKRRTCNCCLGRAVRRACAASCWNARSLNPTGAGRRRRRDRPRLQQRAGRVARTGRRRQRLPRSAGDPRA
ncbi:hypothetical protein M8494_22895 [Serratia ureilytica]